MKAFFPVGFLCDKFKVSRAAYYASLTPTPAHARRDDMAQLVVAAFEAGQRSEGHRKVTARLHRDGVKVNRKTVAGHMRVQGLACPVAVKQYRVMKRRAARTPDPADLVNRVFTADRPGQLLVGDITYVPTRQGWLFVATVTDVACRKVIGRAYGSRQRAELAVAAMRDAFTSGLVQPGAIFHSDHGVQYRSVEFKNWCAQHGVQQSMGARYECWDNAVAESFFSKLKTEWLDQFTFKTRAHAEAEVAAYISRYNNDRLHQSLGYQTPNERLAQLLAA